MELSCSLLDHYDGDVKISNLKSKIINGLSTYSSSTDLNKFGGRFKYSKVINVIDNMIMQSLLISVELELEET